jgi:hypothetical protein
VARRKASADLSSDLASARRIRAGLGDNAWDRGVVDSMVRHHYGNARRY